MKNPRTPTSKPFSTRRAKKIKRQATNLVLDADQTIEDNGAMTSLHVIQTIERRVQSNPTYQRQPRQRPCRPWSLGQPNIPHIIEVHFHKFAPVSPWVSDSSNLSVSSFRFYTRDLIDSMQHRSHHAIAKTDTRKRESVCVLGVGLESEPRSGTFLGLGFSPTLWGVEGRFWDLDFGFEIWSFVLRSGFLGIQISAGLQRRVKMAVGSLRESRRRARPFWCCRNTIFRVLRSASLPLQKKTKKNLYIYYNLHLFFIFWSCCEFFSTCSSFFFIKIFGMVVQPS